MCLKCKDGLIPLKKDGKVFPYAFIHCGCYQEPEEHYHKVTMEDYDFSMSPDTWRSICYYHGWPCQEEAPKELEPIIQQHLHVNLDRTSFQHEERISSLEGGLKHIHEGLHKGTDKKKQRYTLYE